MITEKRQNKEESGLFLFENKKIPDGCSLDENEILIEEKLSEKVAVEKISRPHFNKEKSGHRSQRSKKTSMGRLLDKRGQAWRQHQLAKGYSIKRRS